jgi:hypothetical protein
VRIFESLGRVSARAETHGGDPGAVAPGKKKKIYKIKDVKLRVIAMEEQAVADFGMNQTFERD